MAGTHPDFEYNFPEHRQHYFPEVEVINEVAGIDQRREVAVEKVCGERPEARALHDDVAAIDDAIEAVEHNHEVDLVQVDAAEVRQVDYDAEVGQLLKGAVHHRHRATAKDREAADFFNTGRGRRLENLLEERPNKKQYTHACVCREKQASTEAKQVG